MNDTPSVGKHTGSLDDLAPLFTAMREDGLVGQMRTVLARALLGITDWPSTVAASYDLNLSHPEVIHLRRIARAGSGERKQDLQPSLVAYLKYLHTLPRLVLAQYFGELTHQITEHRSADLLRELGTIYRKLSLFNKAWTIWEELDFLGRTIGGPTGDEYRVQAVNGQGMVMLYKGNLYDAEHLFRQVRREALTDLETKAWGILNLGIVLERTERIVEAGTTFWEAFHHFPLYFADGRWKALTNVGVILRKEGLLEAADNAFWCVQELSQDWTLQTNAMIERLDIASALDDRLELKRLNWTLAARYRRMESPTMICDYLYRLGLLAWRQGGRPELWWSQALELATDNNLHQWVHRLEQEQQQTHPPAIPAPSEDRRLIDVGAELLTLAGTAGKL